MNFMDYLHKSICIRSSVENGTLGLKHMVAKKIGENVVDFELPSVATYLVKDEVEKWGASVVKDTIEERLKT